MTARVAIDALAVQHSGRGVSRVLRQLAPLLLHSTAEVDAFVLTTAQGAQLIGPVDGEVVIVPRMPKSVWEQTALPSLAIRHGADRLYTHSECGPLWGPATLLHVPEDPYVRWSTAPVDSRHEWLRRSYQRAVMPKSIARAARLVASSQAIADQLRARFAPPTPFEIVPLGVDTTLFYPDHGGITDLTIFHLGSDEPRDQTEFVLTTYATALTHCPSLPDLFIAGNLVQLRPRLLAKISALGLAHRVHLLGRVSDNELRRLYSQCAICLQPARYEGFGLQPLEALACSAPLVALADPAVANVVGDAATLVADHSIESFAYAISTLWQDHSTRTSHRIRGLERAATFTWKRTAHLLTQQLLDMTRHS